VHLSDAIIMESSNKAVHEETGQDRISQFPDSVLHQISSYLGTKHACASDGISKEMEEP